MEVACDGKRAGQFRGRSTPGRRLLSWPHRADAIAGIHRRGGQRRLVTYTVRRSGGKTGDVSVDYATVAGSAQPGSDSPPYPARSPGTMAMVDDKTIEHRADGRSEPGQREFPSIAHLTDGRRCACRQCSHYVHSEADGPEKCFLSRLFSVTHLAARRPNIQVMVARSNGSEGEISVSYVAEGGDADARRGLHESGAPPPWRTQPKFIEVDYLEDAAPKRRIVPHRANQHHHWRPRSAAELDVRS